MSEFSPAQAEEFFRGGLEQLDHLLVGEGEAKLGSMVAMASGLNIVLVGQPGGGKTTLGENMHRMIDGIDEEHVAVIPPLSDLPPQQLVGGEVEVSKEHETEDTSWTERMKTVVSAIIKPETKVIFANEINRISPLALNAMLEALEQGKLITSAGVRKLDGLEFGVSTMNPSEKREATFRMTSASASRHAVGAVLGVDEESRGLVTEKVFGGWEPAPEKMEKVISLDGLHALRRKAREGVAIPGNVKRDAVERIHAVTDNLRSTSRIDEADARLAKHVSIVSRTLAALRAQDAITEVDLEEALNFVVTARLGILATGNVKEQANDILRV